MIYNISIDSDRIEKSFHIRKTNNGYLIHVTDAWKEGGRKSEFATIENHIAKDMEGVVEIVNKIIGEGLRYEQAALNRDNNDTTD